MAAAKHLLTIGLLAARAASSSAAAGELWRQLKPGLELGRFQAVPPDESGDGVLKVLRIDPKRFQFKLLSVKAGDAKANQPPSDWLSQYGLDAVINAGMYQADHLTPVSYLRQAGRVLHPRISQDKSFLVFDRRATATTGGSGAVRLIDRDCTHLKLVMGAYQTVLQNIRMISCRGKNVWKPGKRKWSIAAVAQDGRGRVLFLHQRTPIAVHDLIDRLLALPLDIRRAMYVEGGPEAQLSVRDGGKVDNFIGRFAAPAAPVGLRIPWPVPNVIGIVAKR